MQSGEFAAPELKPIDVNNPFGTSQQPKQESQDPWADFRNSYLNNQSKLGDAQIQQGNNANTMANNMLNFGMAKYNQDASAEQENNLYNRAMNEQSLHKTGMFNAENYMDQHRQPINLNFNQQPVQQQQQPSVPSNFNKPLLASDFNFSPAQLARQKSFSTENNSKYNLPSGNFLKGIGA